MSSIKLYNSLTKRVEEFRPINDNKINFYVCGVTVYDYCHLGHGRIFVVFDLLYRLFKLLGYEVNYIRNVTDIDDKIINKANQQSVPYYEVADKFYQAMLEDEDSLNIIRPTVIPKASEHIGNIIDFIKDLIDKDYAYVDNGNVYYRVKKFQFYGFLAHQSIDCLLDGVRIDNEKNKECPLDFTLWKNSKPGEPAWDSPWGLGRPGWHIECSAMSRKYLGDQFDLHGGGMDLLFPHHQNELAQSQAVTDKLLANYWMHVGFVQYKQEKMSKSLGNFFTLRDLLKKFSGETIRYFYLTSQYQNPINFTFESMIMAENSLRSLYLALKGFNPTSEENNIINIEQIKNHCIYYKFVESLKNNLNTPICLSILFEIVHEINQAKKNKQKNMIIFYQNLLYFLGKQLGIFSMQVDSFLKSGVDQQQVKILIKKRLEAKKIKDWNTADRIRSELNQQGVILEDLDANNTEWYLFKKQNHEQ